MLLEYAVGGTVDDIEEVAGIELKAGLGGQYLHDAAGPGIAEGSGKLWEELSRASSLTADKDR